MGSPQVIGRYAIHDRIAAGGMASVHFGRLMGAAGFSRTVAIKRLHPHLAEEPEFLSTLIDEARLAARIHHPNVVPTLDVVSIDGELLVVMEYVRGESLSRLLRTERALQRRVALPIASAIVVGALHGLHAAHEATSDRGSPLGIVHRDVSPQNILVGVDGVPRVIDFGIAKAVGRLQTTREGTIKGKMSYMAPEQLQGLEVTRRVDVYAMAIVLWEVLTGKRLFEADSEGALFGLVMAGATEPPSRYAPEVSPDLDALVMTALAADPAARFASARDMADALMRIVPPAFATEVGAWVEDAAREKLAQHHALLAEIESASGVMTAGPVHAEAARDGRVDVHDVPTLASQPSSLSVETPNHPTSRRPRSRRVRVASGVGVALLVAGTGLFVWRGSRGTSASVTAASAPFASAAAAASPAAPPPPPPASAPADAPTITTSASTVRPRATTPATPRTKVHSLARPHGASGSAGSIRFVHPD